MSAASPVRQPTSRIHVTAKLTMMNALSGMYPWDAERRPTATYTRDRALLECNSKHEHAAASHECFAGLMN